MLSWIVMSVLPYRRAGPADVCCFGRTLKTETILIELCMSCKDKIFVESEDKIDHCPVGAAP